MDFLIINGKVLKKEEANLTSFFWDDPQILSQQIWFGYGGIPLFAENIKLLIQQLNALQYKTPDFLKEQRELFRIIKRMLNKNKFYRSGIIKIQLILNASQTNYIITSSTSSEFEFPMSTEGMLVNYSGNRKNATNQLNKYAFYNKTDWTIIQSKLYNSGFQNSIILNESGMICEGIASNIFMIKDGILITPAFESGCFEDSLRNPILEVSAKLGLKILEQANIERKHIIEMNEAFFASEEKGINWILGIDNKRFIHQQCDEIHLELNSYLKRKVT
jgi:branched-subunit amino acid aminotransferase/4-amino-4-deoxychorismate lyase